MWPRELIALVAFLIKRREFARLANNLLGAWGPKNKPLLGPRFLPPRFVDKNEDTINDVRIRTVAAADGTRYSPAQKVDGGEMFGSIKYRLGHSDILREITGPDYDAITKWLNQNLSMQAAARMIYLFNAMLVQSLAEHDELKVWEAIQFNKLTKRGDNGYFEYEEGPDLSTHFVAVPDPITDPEVDPFDYISAVVDQLIGLGFDRAGLRFVSTNRVLNAMRRNPKVATRAGKSLLTTDMDGTVKATRISGTLSMQDLSGVFEAEGLQAPIEYDRRIQTRTGEKRAYAEGHMTVIASTGMDEEVRFNQDNPEDVRVVNDVLGFNGIGTPNGTATPQRRTAVRAYTDQKDARIEFEGWQATGPVILVPQARVELSDLLG
ncbi:MAG TPA: hypothetical protein VF543_22425 [Pyrinomonadaceae bacterium]|jgi:hypothetical protein